MSVFSISVARHDNDVEQADTCYRAANLFLMRTVQKFSEFSGLANAQINNVTSSESCLFIAKWKDLVVATAYIETSGLLLYVSVLPTFQKKGIASLMLQACHEWAMDHGLKSVTAEVYVGNSSAFALYHENGYELVKTEENVEDNEMPFHVFTKKIN